jgi:HAE1 family hydrophobic/amphiphilic exporter-1/multidrug efflux pump
MDFPILIALVLIYVFYNLIQRKQLHMMTEVHYIRMTAPEGASYEYMDRFMQEISQLVDDSIPQKKVALTITSPGFGSSSVNSGFMRVSQSSERSLSQHDIADKLTTLTKGYVDAKTR